MKNQVKIGLIVGVLSILLLTAVMIWWVFGYNNRYVPLYEGLDERQMAQVVTQLKEQQLAYEIDAAGRTVLVPESDLQETKVQMTSVGALSTTDVGLELFNEVDYGLTDFAQKVNFQRAMQGELARTIMQFPEVKLARVHLTLPKKSLFKEQQSHPKASITIISQEHSQLTPSQVKGIQQLVAASIEQMQPEHVTVVNAQGEVLSGAANGSSTGLSVNAERRLQDKIQYETYLKEKVLVLLGQYFPVYQLSVSVDTQINYDRVEQAVTNYVANGVDGEGVVLKKQNSSITNYDDKADSKQKKPDTNHQYQVEYQNGSKVERTEFAPGTIEKISVGIVLPVELTTEQAQQWSAVIAAGLGLNEQRGDQVQMMGILLPAAPVINPPMTQTLPVLETVASDSPASTGVQTLNTAAQSPVVPALNLNLTLKSPLLWIGAGVALLLVLLLILLTRKTKTEQRQPLSQQEREVLLQQVRQWLQAERS